jgi:hypothetical protein
VFTAAWIVAAAVYYNCHVQQDARCVAVKDRVLEQGVSVRDRVVQQWNAITGKARELAAQEQAAQALLELKQQAEEEAALLLKLKEEEEARLAAEEEERRKALLHRPWACNLPLAYLFHSRCRRLAWQNPVFDVQALINSMLQ